MATILEQRGQLQQQFDAIGPVRTKLNEYITKNDSGIAGNRLDLPSMYPAKNNGGRNDIERVEQAWLKYNTDIQAIQLTKTVTVPGTPPTTTTELDITLDAESTRRAVEKAYTDLKREIGSVTGQASPVTWNPAHMGNVQALYDEKLKDLKTANDAYFNKLEEMQRAAGALNAIAGSSKQDSTATPLVLAHGAASDPHGVKKFEEALRNYAAAPGSTFSDSERGIRSIQYVQGNGKTGKHEIKDHLQIDVTRLPGKGEENEKTVRAAVGLANYFQGWKDLIIKDGKEEHRIAAAKEALITPGMGARIRAAEAETLSAKENAWNTILASKAGLLKAQPNLTLAELYSGLKLSPHIDLFFSALRVEPSQNHVKEICEGLKPPAPAADLESFYNHLGNHFITQFDKSSTVMTIDPSITNKFNQLPSEAKVNALFHMLENKKYELPFLNKYISPLVKKLTIMEAYQLVDQIKKHHPTSMGSSDYAERLLLKQAQNRSKNGESVDFAEPENVEAFKKLTSPGKADLYHLLEFQERTELLIALETERTGSGKTALLEMYKAANGKGELFVSKSSINDIEIISGQLTAAKTDADAAVAAAAAPADPKLVQAATDATNALSTFKQHVIAALKTPGSPLAQGFDPADADARNIFKSFSGKDKAYVYLNLLDFGQRGPLIAALEADLPDSGNTALLDMYKAAKAEGKEEVELFVSQSSADHIKIIKDQLDAAVTAAAGAPAYGDAQKALADFRQHISDAVIKKPDSPLAQEFESLDSTFKVNVILEAAKKNADLTVPSLPSALKDEESFQPALKKMNFEELCNLLHEIEADPATIFKNAAGHYKPYSEALMLTIAAQISEKHTVNLTDDATGARTPAGNAFNLLSPEKQLSLILMAGTKRDDLLKVIDPHKGRALFGLFQAFMSPGTGPNDAAIERLFFSLKAETLGEIINTPTSAANQAEFYQKLAAFIGNDKHPDAGFIKDFQKIAKPDRDTIIQNLYSAATPADPAGKNAVASLYSKANTAGKKDIEAALTMVPVLPADVAILQQIAKDKYPTLGTRLSWFGEKIAHGAQAAGNLATTAYHHLIR
jgi:hypothetical protein